MSLILESRSTDIEQDLPLEPTRRLNSQQLIIASLRHLYHLVSPKDRQPVLFLIEADRDWGRLRSGLGQNSIPG